MRPRHYFASGDRADMADNGKCPFGIKDLVEGGVEANGNPLTYLCNSGIIYFQNNRNIITYVTIV